MQKQSKSQLYKKLLFGSLAIFIIGLLITGFGLSNLYSTVNKCGFGAGNCSTSSTTAHSDIAKIGGYIVAISFYIVLLFLILFLVTRSKERKRNQ
jgi:hypothetical protein